MEEQRSSSPWVSSRAPRKILVIRFHAIGDVVVAIPPCNALRRMFPDAQIDLLTSEACLGIPEALRLFDHVHSTIACPSRWKRMIEQSGQPFSVVALTLNNGLLTAIPAVPGSAPNIK